ncbi:hypothetical protein CDAR_396931 [Caerostris darwini]|uniref:Transmembrane protein n=1 Tax=Caerostris darwini TaxID=1538125 RepID=A0AAV4Q429_9ARAC|nr:hypothetical protein CDAR_396931 [Caerostris darwini]
MVQAMDINPPDVVHGVVLYMWVLSLWVLRYVGTKFFSFIQVGGFWGHSTSGESGMGGKSSIQFFWIDSNSFVCRNSSKPAIRVPFAGTVPIDRRRAFDLLGR